MHASRTISLGLSLPLAVLEFDHRVRRRAQEIFERQEPRRKQSDWEYAIEQCDAKGYVMWNHPKYEAVVAKAEELWRDRQHASSVSDWLEAEGDILEQLGMSLARFQFYVRHEAYFAWVSRNACEDPGTPEGDWFVGRERAIHNNFSNKLR